MKQLLETLWTMPLWTLLLLVSALILLGCTMLSPFVVWFVRRFQETEKRMTQRRLEFEARRWRKWRRLKVR